MAEQILTNMTDGGPVFVHVEDGRITRIRPIVLNETDPPSWTIEARGRKFTPPRKSQIAPFVLTGRANVYSKDRVKYPLQRVDFDPEGDRHPETRGKSGYKRISWDKALDITANEIKRIKSTYGDEAVSRLVGSHQHMGLVNYYQGCFARFMEQLGFTRPIYSPVSWEGWVWGAAHCFGYTWQVGTPEQYDLLEDALKNTELIIHWGSDPDSTHGTYCGQESAIWRQWLKELGIKDIYLDPYCNYSAAIFADKWIPLPRPDTGAALALAIAYSWIDEDTYDHDYVAKRTYGFEDFRKHVMGEDDEIPKTPKWAEEITAVPERTIKALAREWASKRTMLDSGPGGGGFGGHCRAAHAHELERLLVLLVAMQGLGKPGSNFWGTTQGAPFNSSLRFPGYANCGINQVSSRGKDNMSHITFNPNKQVIQKYHIPKAIMKGEYHWIGQGYDPDIKMQFKKFDYPLPGHPKVKMFYAFGGSQIGTNYHTAEWVRCFQNPEIEFLVNQSIWMDGATKFADIILPAATSFERNDIIQWANCGGYQGDTVTTGLNHPIIVYMHKCIEPVGESKSDYEILCAVAERLGFGEVYSEGHSAEEWIEKIFHETGPLKNYISFEEFKKKGYFVVPVPEDYKPTPALRWFAEGRDCDTPDYQNPKLNTDKANELNTPSGKIEFLSKTLLEFEPDDKERPPVPTYVPSWEDCFTELAHKYPLHLITPHPRFTFHTHEDHNDWLGEIPGHRVLKNGYSWRTMRINPVDAAARGIKHGDIVKIHNDRGAVLGIAQVTERMSPGVLHCYASCAKYEPLEPGNPNSPDKAGAINLLTSDQWMSKKVCGTAPNSTLVEISKWEV